MRVWRYADVEYEAISSCSRNCRTSRQFASMLSISNGMGKISVSPRLLCCRRAHSNAPVESLSAAMSQLLIGPDMPQYGQAECPFANSQHNTDALIILSPIVELSLRGNQTPRCRSVLRAEVRRSAVGGSPGSSPCSNPAYTAYWDAGQASTLSVLGMVSRAFSLFRRG